MQTGKTRAEELAAELLKHADDHKDAAHSFDMRPEDSLNLQHMLTAQEAAAELRRLAGVEAERDLLAAEVEALRADAERYRAVRDDDCHPYGICIWDEDDGWAQDARKPEIIDADIDAARKG